jgi:hypothetical protein
MSAVVFVGPTLPRADAESVLQEVVYLPPARQGDVFRAVRKYRPRAVGLIDGAFRDVPAVWHRELLWAMQAGVHVWGAASMGALRAAELAPFGMRGVGCIFAAYRDGRWGDDPTPFEDDDEVAVIHAPADAGAAPLSDAMVDLRATLDRAMAEGVIDPDTSRHLSARMKALHFPERSFARLAAEAADDPRTAALADWLRINKVSQKRLDACALLREMGALLQADPPPFHSTFRFEHALVWEQFLRTVPELEETELLVLEELRLDPVSYRAAEAAALGRIQAEDAAPDLAAVLDRFRTRLGLWRRADLDAWMERNALDAAGLERLLRREAALDAARRDAGPALRTAILEHLRLSDQFAPLHARAQAKRRALASPPPLAPAGPAASAALDWYFTRKLGLPLPRSVAAWAREHGWSDEQSLTASVWQDYLFAETAR